MCLTKERSRCWREEVGIREMLRIKKVKQRMMEKSDAIFPSTTTTTTAQFTLGNHNCFIFWGREEITITRHRAARN